MTSIINQLTKILHLHQQQIIQQFPHSQLVPHKSRLPLQPILLCQSTSILSALRFVLLENKWPVAHPYHQPVVDVVVDCDSKHISFEYQEFMGLVDLGYWGKNGLEKTKRLVQLLCSYLHRSNDYLLHLLLIAFELTQDDVRCFNSFEQSVTWLRMLL